MTSAIFDTVPTKGCPLDWRKAVNKVTLGTEINQDQTKEKSLFVRRDALWTNERRLRSSGSSGGSWIQKAIESNSGDHSRTAFRANWTGYPISSPSIRSRSSDSHGLKDHDARKRLV
jgi:hypothetical protein